jgi:hypothetical protein
MAIHQKAYNLLSKQMHLSATSYYCTTNVNLHLSVTVPGASALTGQRNLVQALGITG